MVHLELVELIFSQWKESAVLGAITFNAKLTFRALIARNDLSFNIFLIIFILAPLVGNELELANRGVQIDLLVVVVGGKPDSQVKSIRIVEDMAIVKVALTES